MRGILAAVFAPLIGVAAPLQGADARIDFFRLPAGALQPELASDSGGRLHAVWLSGDPAASDVSHAVLGSDGQFVQPPARVNSQSGSAIALGTIRGARLALGSNGTVHVVWNGSQKALPRPAKSSPFFYSRALAGGPGFEAQRNLIHSTADLDGGGAVAVDAAGKVHVFWHAGDGITNTREDRRRVYESVSADGGAHFDREHPIDPGDGTGVCGCCGLRATSNRQGRVFVAYRGARELVHRGTYLLESNASDSAAPFQVALLQDWSTGSCPMSLPALSVQQRTDGVQAAWETEGHVYWTPAPNHEPIRLESGAGARHPSMASNARGETVLVWTEGTGWNRGGRLAWRLLDPQGNPTASGGVREGVPVWSFGAVAARPDGSFLIAY